MQCYIVKSLFSKICCGFCHDYRYLCLTNLTRRFTIATLYEGREKKSYPELFEQVLSGEKTFNMRIADITIEPGDILEQVEVTHDGVPTGRTVRHTVGTVLRTKEIDFWPPEEIDRYGYQVISLRSQPSHRHRSNSNS